MASLLLSHILSVTAPFGFARNARIGRRPTLTLGVSKVGVSSISLFLLGR